MELEIPDQSNRQLLEEQKEALVQEKKKFMAKHLSKEPEDLYRDMTETIETEVPGAGSRPIRLGKVFSNAQVRSVEYQLGWDGLGKRQDSTFGDSSTSFSVNSKTLMGCREFRYGICGALSVR